jgi:murein DD-endopeptidase MepM/ murein hydrolase activator NlpD
MSSRSISILTAVVAGVLLLCLAGPAVILGGGIAAACTPTATTPPTTATSADPTARWDGDQVGNAQVIVTVGTQRGIPPRGWVIAVSTAMQESGLRNLAGGDRDSVGLFQQRPSQGWGNPDQLQDPAYAAGKFYDKLVTVPGWEQMPLTRAAQAVQVSAFPNAYAKWEDNATTLVTTLTGEVGGCAPVGPGGWVMPVDGPIVSGFRTTERPGHDGIDIAAPKGTIIRAASSGVVTLIRCNASLNGAPYSCDIDGSPAVLGCGWYTEITHPGNLITRYCHQLHRPPVRVGKQVAAGEPIGVVGTSGHSSGPHLHFEVHTGNPASEANAVDSIAFLHSVGVATPG